MTHPVPIDYQAVDAQSLDWIEKANEPVLALGRHYPAGLEVAIHAHRRAQLWFARTGIVLVSTREDRWLIPPGHALVIPARVEHGAVMISDVEMHSIYVDGDMAQASHPRVVEVTELARTLIGALVEDRHGHATVSATSHRRGLIMDLLLDEFSQLPERPLGLPMPIDARLAALCRRFLAAPSARISIDDWARETGVSRRTFTRHFRQQTGLSFVTWRQQACLFASLPRLAAGEPVTTVALDAGYENIPAFTTMFRRMLGQAPSRYFALSIPGNRV